MERFQNVVLKLAESLPNAPLAPPARALLQDRLNRFAAHYKTPDHPPYSAMIEKAIRELDEKKGSTEDSISRLLMKEYNNLPWAHTTMLKHYLENLCVSGDIVLTRNRYKLPRKIPIPNPLDTKVKKSPVKKRTMWKWDWEKEKRRRLRKKKKLAKLRIQQRSKKAKAVEKHKEQDESADKFIEGNPVSGDITILPTQEKDLPNSSLVEIEPMLADQQLLERHQESDGREEQLMGQNPVSSDISTLMAQDASDQLKISKAPGFENLYNPRLGEVEAAHSKELSDSERARRQMRRWNQSPPESKGVVSMTFHGSEEKHSPPIQERLNLEKGPVPVKVDEVYGRRLKPEKDSISVKVNEVYTRRKKVTSEPQFKKTELQPDIALSNGKGPQELPQIKVSQPRRSTRLMTSAKPEVNDVMSTRLTTSAKPKANDVMSYVIALPAQNCPKGMVLLSDDRVGAGQTPKRGGRGKQGKVKA